MPTSIALAAVGFLPLFVCVYFSTW